MTLIMTSSALTLNKLGYNGAKKLDNSLQGSVWKAKQQSTNQNIVIKITQKDLHKKSASMQQGTAYMTPENIKSETVILRYLTSKTNCPKSIVRYIDFFRTYVIF